MIDSLSQSSIFVLQPQESDSGAISLGEVHTRKSYLFICNILQTST